MDVELQIIRGTLDLFHLYGVRALTLEDISRLIKLPLKVVKKFFPTKEQLLQKCVRYRIGQEEIFKYTDDHLPDVLINFAEAYPVLYKRIDRRCCMEIKKYYNSVFSFLYRYLEFYAVVCQNKVPEGIANGYIRRTVAPELVYVFFREHLAGLFSMDAEWYASAEDFRITQKILAFTREIMTAKGRIYIDKKLQRRIDDETD